MNRRSGFTLVELLVVVAIIALLLGILLPALGKARDVARTAVCASNMRQVAIGFVIYADSHNGSCVPGRPGKIGSNADPRNLYNVGNGQQYRPRWFITLGAQSGIHAYDEPSTDHADDNTKLVDNKVFICPQASDRRNNRNFGYGYNYQFLGNARSHASGRFINFPVKIASLATASTIMAADTMGTAAGKPADQRTAYNPSGSGNQTTDLSNHGWSLDPPRLIAGSSDFCDDKNRRPADRSAPEPRHAGRANASHCDGHVSAMTRQQMGYHVREDDSVDIDGPGVNNRQFSGTAQDDDPPAIN